MTKAEFLSDPLFAEIPMDATIAINLGMNADNLEIKITPDDDYKSHGITGWKGHEQICLFEETL